jgi:hypothetical protein
MRAQLTKQVNSSFTPPAASAQSHNIYYKVCLLDGLIYQVFFVSLLEELTNQFTNCMTD